MKARLQIYLNCFFSVFHESLAAVLIFNLIEHLTTKLWKLKIASYSNFCDFSRIFAIFYNFEFLLQPLTT